MTSAAEVPAHNETARQTAEAEAILAEILALRKIVINLLYGELELAGEPLDEGRSFAHTPLR
jgi:hypothetical protein